MSSFLARVLPFPQDADQRLPITRFRLADMIRPATRLTAVSRASQSRLTPSVISRASIATRTNQLVSKKVSFHLFIKSSFILPRSDLLTDWGSSITPVGIRNCTDQIERLTEPEPRLWNSSSSSQTSKVPHSSNPLPCPPPHSRFLRCICTPRLLLSTVPRLPSRDRPRRTSNQ